MITLDDKLDIFYKVVFKEEEERCKKALEELEERNKLTLEEKIVELEKKKEEIITRRKLLAETQKNEMLSKAIGENRSRILQKREETLTDLISSLENKAKEFVLSKDYKGYVLDRILNVIKEIEEEEIVIGLLEKDKKDLEETIRQLGEDNNKNISFYTVVSDIIGGFILSDKNRSYNLDNSFKTIIEENKYLIGKRLYSSLEKTGGLNG